VIGLIFDLALPENPVRGIMPCRGAFNLNVLAAARCRTLALRLVE
jgi:hypothetical protein